MAIMAHHISLDATLVLDATLSDILFVTSCKRQASVLIRRLKGSQSGEDGF